MPRRQGGGIRRSICWAGGMDAEREKGPIEPGPEPDTTTAAEADRSDDSLDGDDQPIE
ncbi:hypothetical protein QE430_002814 [Microbacterium testaceum]|nr:hypothetical protein [Microbacterium testaceum]